MAPLEVVWILCSLWRKVKVEEGESESLPEPHSLCFNLRQRFGYYESDRWPWDDGWLREDYH